MSSLFYQKGVYQPIVINFNRIDGSSPTVIDVKCKVETYTLDATYFTVLSNGDMTNRAGTNVWVRPWRPRPSLKSGVYFITYTYTIDGTDSTFVETVTLGAFGGGGSMGNYPNDYLRFDDKRLDVLDNLLTKDYFDERIVGLNKLSLLVNKLDELSLKFDSFNLDNINFDVLKDDFSIFFNDLNKGVVENKSNLSKVLKFCNDLIKKGDKNSEGVVGELSKFKKFSISKFKSVNDAHVKSSNVLKKKFDLLERKLGENTSKMSSEANDSFSGLKKLIESNEHKLLVSHAETNKFVEDSNKVLTEEITSLKDSSDVNSDVHHSELIDLKENMVENSKIIDSKFDSINKDLVSFSDKISSELNSVEKVNSEKVNDLNILVNEMNNSFDDNIKNLIKLNSKQMKNLDDSFSKVVNKRDLLHSTNQIRDRLSRVKDGFDNKIKFLRSNVKSVNSNVDDHKKNIDEGLGNINHEFDRIKADADLNEMNELLNEEY